MATFKERYPALYTPPAHDGVQLRRFKDLISKEHNVELADYDALWQWSVDNRALFWEHVADFVDFKFTKKHTKVVDESLMPADVPVWFEGAEFNYAQNMLKYSDDRTAIIETGETERDTLITFKELTERVAKFRAALEAVGVTKGDRVCAYIPNCAEAIICMLAAASLGAIWSSTSPDFGVTGVLDRFSQIQPKVIICANAVHYNNKVHSHLDKARQVAEGLTDTLQHVVVFPFVHEASMDISQIPKGIAYDDFLSLSKEESPQMKYVQTPFNHPLVIMFSSGTTGKPKSIVHSAGGTLLQHMKEHVLHGEMTRDSKFMYYSTTGWMMWNWLISGLAIGATVVCFDGSPMLKNNKYMLFDLIDRHDLTVLGVSAKFIDAIEQSGVKPMASHRLTNLKLIYSTGSPLKPASYDYIYRDVKKDVVIGSITGGTDIISLFAGQNFMTPVHRALIHSPCLGMHVQCWNESGDSVQDETGELVCVSAFPSQPIYFWNDDGNTRYQKSYFQGYPGGVWSHGDYIRIHSQTRGLEMLGRSDGVLNPNGVRFGSSELYRITERFEEVADTLAVGQMVDSNDRVVLFVKMNAGCVYTDELVARMKGAIRAELSPRHVPAIVLEIADIPYTLSGKKVEVAIKKIINNLPMQKQEGALRNPDALDLYYDIPALNMGGEAGA